MPLHYIHDKMVVNAHGLYPFALSRSHSTVIGNSIGVCRLLFELILVISFKSFLSSHFFQVISFKSFLLIE